MTCWQRVRRFFLTFLPARPVYVPRENPYTVALDLAKAGDWRGRRFLEASEQLAEVESALVNAFEAEDNATFLDLLYGIEDAHKKVPPYASSGTDA